MERVIVIGGGIAGLATAFDLSLRGVETLLVEKNQLGSGTTTKCAGMLHSGARYIVNHPHVAKDLSCENTILKKIVSFTIDNRLGLFVILKNADPEYCEQFEEGSQQTQIPISKLSRQECLELEPNLGDEVMGGFTTPDAVIDPLQLVDTYREELKEKGVEILEGYQPIKGRLVYTGSWKLDLQRQDSLRPISIACNAMINATGASAAEVASRLGAKLKVTYVHGSMIALKEKVVTRVVSICGQNTTGDVITSLDQTSIVGSTWHELPHNQPIQMSNEDMTKIIETASKVIPKISRSLVSHSFTGIRAHLESSQKFETQNSFNIDRGYQIIDHAQTDSLPNFYTILPGKLTFGRLVAEKVTDLLLSQWDNNIPCQTRNYRLKEPRKRSDARL